MKDADRTEALLERLLRLIDGDVTAIASGSSAARLSEEDANRVAIYARTLTAMARARATAAADDDEVEKLLQLLREDPELARRAGIE